MLFGSIKQKWSAASAAKLIPEFLSIAKWSIGLKLVIILSSIILLTLVTMIYLATYFFRADYQRRVQEYNLSLVETIGKNLEFTLHTIVNTKHEFWQKSASYDALGEQIHKDFLYIGLYEKKGKALAFSRQLSSQKLLIRNKLSLRRIHSHIFRYQQRFYPSLQGSVLLVNLSAAFKRPILALSFPQKQAENSDFVIIVLIAAQFFLDAFQANSDATRQKFMVDEKGTVLAHSDIEITQAELNMSDLPVVAAMQKSPFPAAQIAYQHKDGNSYLGTFRKSLVGNFSIILTVREDYAFAEVYNIQRRNIYLMIAAVNLAILAVLLYSRSLSDPIIKLTMAAQKIARGHFDVKVRNKNRDEIGILTKAFNSMSEGLQERENLKVSLGRLVNKEIAEKALKGKLQLGGEKRKVAILFSDIRNFTTMSEKMQAQEIVHFLNSYFSDMVERIIAHQGTVDKFIGDAIMAHWGAAQDHENAALAAIHTALEMREALRKINKKRRGKKQSLLRFGIGINYGSVVAGQIGSEQHLNYTVIGDAVNVAARLEALTKRIGIDILVTNNALEKIKKNEFSLASLGNIDVRGKEKAIGIYALLGKKGAAKTPANIQELRSMLAMKAM